MQIARLPKNQRFGIWGFPPEHVQKKEVRRLGCHYSVYMRIGEISGSGQKKLSERFSSHTPLT
jgi:hypothetical protein